MNLNSSKPSLTPGVHHVQQEVCTTRPRYRQGRKFTAIKAYTIHHESCYLLIQGVPTLNLRRELKRMFSRYGAVVSMEVLPDYPPSQPFTEVFLCRFSHIAASRKAKRTIDGREFFGSLLHVCYAPECESVEETRQKLFGFRKKGLTWAQRNLPLSREGEEGLLPALTSGTPFQPPPPGTLCVDLLPEVSNVAFHRGHAGLVASGCSPVEVTDRGRQDVEAHRKRQRSPSETPAGKRSPSETPAGKVAKTC